jgi:hypothetical protein
MKHKFLSLVSVAVVLSAASTVRADEKQDNEHKEMVKRGLEYVVGAQQRDGHWEANNGQYPTAMTALSGMVLMMEGSTLREGKYSDHLRRAVDWLIDQSRQSNGIIGSYRTVSEANRYMYGHALGMLFLSCVYGDEEDPRRRKALEDVLTKGVQFSVKAQTSRGGWGYVSGLDSNDYDEGSVTITQLQGLRAARNAGIVVPKKVIDDAAKYLEKSTTPRGGVTYSLIQRGGPERPPLTAGAIASAFSAAEYDSPLCKKWLTFCKDAIQVPKGARSIQDEFGHYYYSQAMYVLGDAGYGKLFPESKEDERPTWSKYRKAMFEYLKNSQANDGSWSGDIGPIYSTTVSLTILQLEKGTLPIYQR